MDVPEIIPFIPEEIIPESTNDILSEGSVHIFPNPCSHYLSIINETGLVFTDYRIVDIAGREVIAGAYPEDQIITNLSMLKSGLFSLQLISEKEVVTRKFIKSN